MFKIEREKMHKAAYKYIIDVKPLDLTFFEIPKNGSSSLKHFLFMNAYPSEYNPKMGVGHGEWKNWKPECWVGDYTLYEKRKNQLAVLREPTRRFISMYENIYKFRMNGEKNIYQFIAEDLEGLLEADSSNSLLNHFKPQDWFLNDDISNIITCRVEEIDKLPKLLIDNNLDVKGEIPFKNKGPTSGKFNSTFNIEDVNRLIRDLYHNDFNLYESAK